MTLLHTVLLLTALATASLADYQLPQLEYGPPMHTFFIPKKQYAVPRPQYPPFATLATKAVVPSTSYGVPDLLAGAPVFENSIPVREPAAFGPVDSYGVPVKPHVVHDIPTTHKPITTTTTTKPAHTTTRAPVKPTTEYSVPIVVTHAPKQPSNEYGPPMKPPKEYGVPTTVKPTTTPKPKPTTTTAKPVIVTTKAPSKPANEYAAPKKPAEKHHVPAPVKPATSTAAPVLDYGVPHVDIDKPFHTVVSKPAEPAPVYGVPGTYSKPYPAAGVPQPAVVDEYMIPSAPWQLENENAHHGSAGVHLLAPSSSYVGIQKSYVHQVHRPHFLIPKINGVSKLFPFAFPRLSYYK